MKNNSGIESVAIKKLFTNRNVSLNLSDGVRIIVGENGLGKTTILNILNEILNGNVENIVDFPLDAVEVKFSGLDSPFIFSRSRMQEFLKMRRNILVDLDGDGVDSFISLLIKVLPGLPEPLGRLEIDRIVTDILAGNPSVKAQMEAYNVSPERYLTDWIVGFTDVFSFKAQIKSRELDIVFLPTYRRIEADLKKIVPPSKTMRQSARKGYPVDSVALTPSMLEDRIFTQKSPMKFGMKDISSRIGVLLDNISSESIKGYNEVSTRMIARLLDPDKDALDTAGINPGQIEIVLERLRPNMPEKEYTQLKKAVRQGDLSANKDLAYYLISLSDVYERTKEFDDKLTAFRDTVNTFLYDKEFRYDKNHVRFELFFRDDNQDSNPIPIQKLSSGEKQLVALFAMAYLSVGGNLVFIIDEPELSLSLTWQKLLLPSLRNAPNTAMIIAATHSPFIFDNDLKQFTIGGVEYVSPVTD